VHATQDLNVQQIKDLIDAYDVRAMFQRGRRAMGLAIFALLLPFLLTTTFRRSNLAAAVGDRSIATQERRAADLGQTLEDNDSDGIDDRLEDGLAERFAPIVYHGELETSFPVSVDWWLERTHLGTIDTTSWPGRTRRVVAGPLRQEQLLNHISPFDGVMVSSSGTRSRGKHVSFFLEDVPKSARPQSIRPEDWVTYVHSYPNESGGITLQYWRAYAWDDARFAGLDVGHGGDWEGIAVQLDSSLKPVKTTYLDHTGIVDWGGSVRWEGTHPLVWSEEGGHSSYPDNRHMRSAKFIRQDTWTGGVVTRWDGTVLGMSGGLLNVGEKSRPRNGQTFVQYSGLWGSPGSLFLTSGYWGPAFNETDAQCADGGPAYKPYLSRRADSSRCGRIYLKAWCDGMKDHPLNRAQECYATDDAR